MTAYFKMALTVLCGALLGLLALPAPAAEPVKTLNIELGTWEGDFAVSPTELTLTAGEHYRLVFVNWSREFRHVMISPQFERAVLTQAIRTYPERDAIRGASLGAGINVPPGERVEFYFVPHQQGRYTLSCQDRAHTDAGMEITIDVRL